ncbi:MAG: phenylalanine--tRNA ligase subunit beta [Chlorobiaceae bacterium]|nr:phenylalanine--tRNA ligase subunit beta [Chlorobiaceae bacterium]MBA4308821.1 phenylalanine--tRNA ligase subunit beta [Chlorobiaceae bacterium]
MKVSLNWLKDYVDLNGIPQEQLIEKLTLAGLEVEGVEDQNKIYENFVVGLVTDKQAHPKADKLTVCIVNDGQNDYQVVCGAPNVEKNQKIIFAKIDAIIPENNLKISKVKLRGIESFGMICSDKELNLGDDHSGIKVLPDNFVVGASISEALELNDTILEIAITPNRPDALSHIGIAREISALFNRELILPKVKDLTVSEKINSYASVEILDDINCPRYSSKVILDVEIKESPEWLKKKLKAVGLRPINNVVDATNFILLELGQPLHAFDLDQLANKKIVVKKSTQVKFITLDSKERNLNESVLMICDGEKSVAIAGVMGGENSEISLRTKNILIESAYFNPSSIRKTSKYLGLSTESSYRFERGIDPSNTLFAAERVAELIHEIGGGTIVDGFIDVYPNKIFPKEVILRYSRLLKILGYEIEKEKVKEILTRLGTEIINENENSLSCSIPTFRPDVEREIDLIEEIARIYGYENIPTVEKISTTLSTKIDESKFLENLREIFVALGFNEMINTTLASEKNALLTGEPIKLLNPQTEEMAVLRTSLIQGALETLRRNIFAGEKNLKLFEFGKVFAKKSDAIENFSDFEEIEKGIIIITGKSIQSEWYSADKFCDFYDLKGYVNSLLKKINLDSVLFDSYYHSGNNIFDYYFEKKSKNGLVGFGGKVSKTLLGNFDIDQDVYLFEFSVDVLKTIEVSENKFKELLRFPKVNRDFAFIFDKSISNDEVKIFVKQKASTLLKSIKLFDIFESKNLGENKKSMAYTLEFFDMSRTLTEEEVEKEFLYLIEEVKNKFNAALRGS